MIRSEYSILTKVRDTVVAGVFFGWRATVHHTTGLLKARYEVYVYSKSLLTFTIRSLQKMTAVQYIPVGSQAGFFLGNISGWHSDTCHLDWLAGSSDRAMWALASLSPVSTRPPTVIKNGRAVKTSPQALFRVSCHVQFKADSWCLHLKKKLQKHVSFSCSCALCTKMCCELMLRDLTAAQRLRPFRGLTADIK